MVAPGGETLSAMCARTVIWALADCDASAWLVTKSVTGLGEGVAPGAKYSTLPAGAELTCWHGLDARTQICPTVVFPPGIPLISHVTFVLGVPEIEAVNIWRWLTARVELNGVSARDTVLEIVTLALPVALGFAELVAWTVTVGGVGNDAGAV